MKKLLAILIIFFASSSLQAENVYDYLERDTESLGSILYLKTHNKGSKDIYIEKIKIWFTKCSNKSGDPNRIYAVNKYNRSYRDLEHVITTSWNHDGSYCYVLSARFYEPPKVKKFKPKPKSGSQKWLDKIRGN